MYNIVLLEFQKCSIFLHLNDIAKNGGVELRMQACMKMFYF